MSVTYTKLKSGDWGVRGSGLREGATVTVHKKDGSQKEEVIEKIVFTAKNGVQLAAIRKSAPSGRRYSSGGGCRSCARARRGGYLRQHLFDGCDECGCEEDG